MTAAEAGAILSQAFEARARELLERYIPLREFQVTATVTPSDKPLPLTPYDPAGIVLSRSAEEISDYVRNVDMEVLLTTRLQSTKNRLQQLLSKELGLSSRRGDRVRFGNLGIEIEEDSWRQEKNELKTDLGRLKQENDRLSRELSRSQQQEGFLGKYTVWVALGALILVFGTVIFGLFMAGRSLSVAGRNLSGAFTTIASAVENVGGSIQAAAGISPQGSDQPKVMEGKLIAEGSGKGNGMASLPMESINAHFSKLRGELLETVHEGTEALIIRHITHLLSNPTTVGRAVVTLELLGRDMATELFKRLGLTSQEALLKFMREGTYEKPKVELMLEAGEELKTKILVDSLDMARGRPSEKVAEKILQLTDEDLNNLAAEIAPELMPRLFLYLEAPKIAGVIASLKNNNQKVYQKVLSLLPKMPEAEQANNLDQEIMRAIDLIINKTKSDAQRPFLQVYKEIIEAAEDDLSEDIVRELSADPRLDQYFRENVITVRTFFRLTDEARADIIEGLSNKDIAALAYGARDEERKTIMVSLPARRKGMIAEEFESLSSRGGRQAQYAYKRVRDQIVKKLTDMKNDGTLGGVLRREDAKPASGGGAGKGGGGGAFGGGGGGARKTENTSVGTSTQIGKPALGAGPKAPPGMKSLDNTNVTSPGFKPPPTKKAG